mgnify:CR=1 FL=1
MLADNQNGEHAVAFERAFLATVLEWMETRGFTVNAFAKKAFPEGYRSDPVRRFRAMVTQGRLGKPQRINLADAYLISEGLGVDLPYLIFITRQRLIEEAQLEAGLDQNAKSAGR